MSSDATDNSSVEEGSSINSGDLWVNPLSLEKEKNEESDEYTSISSSELETSEGSETSESSKQLESSKSNSKLSYKKEEKNSESLNSENHPIFSIPSVEEVSIDSNSNGRRNMNFSYLYELMDESIPEDILKRESIIKKEENLAINELNCPKCGIEILKNEIVQFQPCKHSYCINCVLNSHGTTTKTIFYQCPILSCSSTYSHAKIEELFPSHVTSFNKYRALQEEKKTNINNEQNNLQDEFKKKRKRKLSIGRKASKSKKKEYIDDSSDESVIDFVNNNNNINLQSIENEYDIVNILSSSPAKPNRVMDRSNSNSGDFIVEKRKKKRISLSRRLSSKNSFSSSSSLKSNNSIKLQKMEALHSNSNRRLKNVLSVSCPQCKSPVSVEPNEEMVVCSECYHGFCFACLQPLMIDTAQKHQCVSSTDLFDSDSEGKSPRMLKRKRSFSSRFISLIPVVRTIVRTRSKSKL